MSNGKLEEKYGHYNGTIFFSCMQNLLKPALKQNAEPNANSPSTEFGKTWDAPPPSKMEGKNFGKNLLARVRKF